MFRLLILGVIVTLLYLSFAYVSEYDTQLHLLVDNLQVELSLFTFVVIFFLAQFALLITLKVIAVALNLPSILHKKWREFKNKKIHAQLMQSIVEFTAGSKESALKIVMSIYKKLSCEGKDIANVIIADSSEQSEVRVEYYKLLLTSDKLSGYASKKLAEIYLLEKEYLKAEKFALQYFDKNEDDEENILVLLQVYVALKQWKKLSLLSIKMKKIKSDLWIKNIEKMAEYFYNAAQDLVKKEDEEEAKEYLLQSLEIKPDYIPALNLYTEISISNKQGCEVADMLKTAFKFNICFEIGRMYADCCNEKPEIVYNMLASTTDPKAHQGSFLALAAYLGLNDKVNELKGK